jgi:hypothetical protein
MAFFISEALTGMSYPQSPIPVNKEKRISLPLFFLS